MSAAKVRQNEEMDNIRVQFVSLYVGKHNSLEYLCTGHSQDVYPKHKNYVPTFFNRCKAFLILSAVPKSECSAR